MTPRQHIMRMLTRSLFFFGSRHRKFVGCTHVPNADVLFPTGSGWCGNINCSVPVWNHLFLQFRLFLYTMQEMTDMLGFVLCRIIVMLLMLWHLNKKTTLAIPNMNNLQLGGYFRSGRYLLPKRMSFANACCSATYYYVSFELRQVIVNCAGSIFYKAEESPSAGALLVGRTVASVMTITMSTSMAARQGAVAVAAHQICLQVWLSASLVIDAQAAAAQVSDLYFGH